MPEGLTVVQHPVLEDRLAVLRNTSTPHNTFRQALSEASAILAVESTRDLPTVAHTINTPLEPAPGRRLETEITIVPVLRAGLGMVDGFLRLLAGARVGHLGMQRDEDTLEPTGYYERLPPGMGEAHVFLLDPMLATGGSAVAALARLRASRRCARCTPTCRSGPRRATASSTRTATSGPGSGMPATASSARRADAALGARGVAVEDYLAHLGAREVGPPSVQALAELQARH